MSARPLSLPIVLILLMLVFTAAAAGIETCFPLEPEPRVSCLEAWLTESAPLDSRTIASLDPWIEKEAQTVLSALDLVLDRMNPSGAVPDGVRASALERKGMALRALSRDAEAAAAFTEALRLDDGVGRIAWWSGAEAPAWTVEVDVPNDRLVRAADAFAAAGNLEEARAVLTRALRLGAGDAALRSWGEIDDGPAPSSATSGRLVAEPWYEPAADVEIELLEGGSMSLARARGRVLLVDFWATWCEPCVRELPQLEAFHLARRDRGMVAVAVNVGEAPELIRPFVQSLKLELPVGLSDSALTRAFDVDSLPALVVIDARGRIRGRWNGYREDLLDQVDGVVEGLLSDASVEPLELARVLSGDGALDVAWSRQGPAPVDGMTIEPSAGERPGRIVIASDRQLVSFGATGSATAKPRAVPYAVGSLRGADLDGDGSGEVIGFRRAGTSVVHLEAGANEQHVWDAPAPVLDLWPRSTGNATGGEVLLATVRGLYRADVLGKSLGAAIEGEPILGLALQPAQGGARGVVAATASGSLIWLDGELREVRRQHVGPIGVGLVPPPPGASGAGILPASVIASAAGRFLAGGTQLALGTSTGQLLLLDLQDGRERFRARWPGINGLAAGDLDGDGVDELALASGRRLTLLRSPPASREGAASRPKAP